MACWLGCGEAAHLLCLLCRYGKAAVVEALLRGGADCTLAEDRGKQLTRGD